MSTRLEYEKRSFLYISRCAPRYFTIKQDNVANTRDENYLSIPVSICPTWSWSQWAVAAADVEASSVDGEPASARPWLFFCLRCLRFFSLRDLYLRFDLRDALRSAKQFQNYAQLGTYYNNWSDTKSCIDSDVSAPSNFLCVDGFRYFAIFTLELK